MDKSVFEDIHFSNQTTTNGHLSQSSEHNQHIPSFLTILNVIHRSLIGPKNYSDFMQNIADNTNTHDNTNNPNPTISAITTHFANKMTKSLKKNNSSHTK